jgi:Flp pilus assembly protein TadG
LIWENRRNQTGSAVIEVVIVIPFMMLVILLAVQAALWVDAAAIVQAAASVGSETAAASRGTPSEGLAATDAYLSAHGSALVTRPSVHVEALPDGFVEVRVDATAESIVGLLHLGVSSVRVEPVQEFRQSG